MDSESVTLEEDVGRPDGHHAPAINMITIHDPFKDSAGAI